jgi:hypothetical protein
MTPRLKVLLTLAILLLVAAFATCHFGIRYAIDQIPEEQRRTMTDVDWVGAEWVFRAMGLAGVALILGLSVGIALWRNSSKTAV